MLHSLHLLTRDGAVLLAHCFSVAPVAAQDAFEGALAAAVRPYLRALSDSDVALAARGLPVVLRAAGGVVFVAAGGSDELALSEGLPFLVRLVTAACDDALSPAQVVAFHGKLVVVLDHAFRGGAQVHSDVPAILRAAKLKAPQA